MLAIDIQDGHVGANIPKDFLAKVVGGRISHPRQHGWRNRGWQQIKLPAGGSRVVHELAELPFR